MSAPEFLETFARAAAGRKVQLLPVSKGQSADHVLQCLAIAGFPQRLGENYVEEMTTKSQVLAPAKPELEWHFLGRLQSRKIREIAAVASWLHTVSRDKELEILASLPRAPQFLIQVNISSEGQKNGVDADEAARLLESSAKHGLKCRGFMGMAAPLSDVGEIEVAKQFATLAQLRDRLLPGGELSMGMSDDYHLAIKEGATLVRVGTRLFGARQAK